VTDGEVACPDAVVFIWRDGTIASWDQAARELFGWAPHEVLGLPFCALFTPDSRHAVDGLARATPSDPLRAVATALNKDGVCFEVEIISSGTLAVRNGSAGVVHVVHDVTERAAVGAALAACAGSPGWTAADALVGEALRRWVPFADLTLEVGENGNAPLSFLAADRNAVVVNGARVVLPLVAGDHAFATLNVTFSEAGRVTARIVRLLAAVADAVASPLARVRGLEETSRAIGRLQQLDRLEKERLALITHDMRTPLAVITGAASSLRDKWRELADEERLAALEAILRNGQSLARLVEQDLELALIDRGERPYEIMTVDLGPELERIIDDVSRTAAVRIALRIDRPLPLVRADQQRHSQVLANLLSNAVKFSPAGADVEVSAFTHGPMVHVAVSDRGPGIASDDARKLFRKFSRVGGAATRAVGGTGLGLYLCKRMVEAQGGRIWVESGPGAGATFTYTLPVVGRGASGAG
jgi:PAS domain S-box-containing protein